MSFSKIAQRSLAFGLHTRLSQFVTRAAAEIHRWGAGEPETNRKRAEETVALAPAIIVAFGSSVAALLQATRSVPVVFAGA